MIEKKIRKKLQITSFTQLFFIFYIKKMLIIIIQIVEIYYNIINKNIMLYIYNKLQHDKYINIITFDKNLLNFNL